MYSISKAHFSFLMCLLVIFMGCTNTDTNREVSQEFSDTMKDGNRFVIKITYKPNGVTTAEGEKFGSYYFIAKHFFPALQNAETETPLARHWLSYTKQQKMRILVRNRSNLSYDQHYKNLIRYGETAEEATRLLKAAGLGDIYMSFYDREGNLLLKRFTPDRYAFDFVDPEENTFDGGMRWKGQFDERVITAENFRDIHSMTVRWGK